MKKTDKKIIPIILASVLCAAAVTGCGKKEETTEKLEFNGYPIRNGTTLTYWMELNGNVAETSEDEGKTRFAEELKNETGVVRASFGIFNSEAEVLRFADAVWKLKKETI